MEELIKRIQESNRIEFRGFIPSADSYGVALNVSEDNSMRTMMSYRWDSIGILDSKYYPTDVEAYEELSKKNTERVPMYDYNKALAYLKEYRPFEYEVLRRIQVYFTEDIETACSYWDKITESFVIELNMKFLREFALIQEVDNHIAVCMVLEHELQHIYRGHCRADEKLPHELLNVIEDTIINREVAYTYGVNFRVGFSTFFFIKGKLKEATSSEKINDLIRRKIRFYRLDPPHEMFTGTLNMMIYNEVRLLGTEDIAFIRGINELCNELFDEFEIESPEIALGGIGDEGNAEGVGVSKESTQALAEISQEVMGSSNCHSGLGSIAQEIVRKVALSKSRNSWKAILRRYMMQGLSTSEVYRPSQPSARIEGQFGRDVDEPKPKVVVLAIDVSGSMEIKDYQYVLSEVESVFNTLRLSRMELHVIWWGATVVNETYRSYRDFKKRCQQATPSLGGTIPELALDEISKIRKRDLAIVFTDGQFRTVRNSKVSVIWSVTPDGITESIKQDSMNKVVKP